MKKTGLEYITEAREYQQKVKGYSLQEDQKYDVGTLSAAASCYALPPELRKHDDHDGTPTHWPWDAEFYKPAFRHPVDTWERRKEELAKAGALIAAEIDLMNSLE